MLFLFDIQLNNNLVKPNKMTIVDYLIVNIGRYTCQHEMSILDKLEDLEKQVWSSDLYVRQEASSELLTVLSEATDEVFDGSFQWDSMCSGLIKWIAGTNFKVRNPLCILYSCIIHVKFTCYFCMFTCFHTITNVAECQMKYIKVNFFFSEH